MLQGKKISNTSQTSIWAFNLVNQYFYRKTFGLTYEEYLKEDVSVYQGNQLIMDIINQIEARELKKAERKGKIK